MIYNVTPKQAKVHRSLKKEIIIKSPVRSGKTYTLLHDMLLRTVNTNQVNLVCGPTYALTHTVLLKEFVNLFSSFISHKNDSEIFLKGGGKLLFRTAHKDAVDKSIRGLNVDNIYLDECALIDNYSLDVIRTRLMKKEGKLIMASTPKGKANWLYKQYFENQKSTVEYISLELKDNPLIDVSAFSEYQASNLDPQMYKQEVLGEFVSLYQDRMYPDFNEENIIDNYTPHIHTKVGFDFNARINAWIACEFEGDKVIVFDEGFGNGTRIKDACSVIKQKYPTCTVVPDATGKAINNQTGWTNIQEIKNCELFVQTPNSNPHRIDRYSLVNSFILNALDKRRLFVTKNCKRLIRELEEISYKETVDEPQLETKEDGHITDALGYVMFEFLGKKNQSPYNMIGHF